jgi:diadenosine tetraphosphate (Ap4A) HIT family hydrolase
MGNSGLDSRLGRGIAWGSAQKTIHASFLSPLRGKLGAMNATMQKFGYPESLVKDHHHWCVLLRPQQVTLGSLVLAAKSDATAFSELPPTAFAELSIVITEIEQSLRRFSPYEKINYLMLMMVDPHVHMHVLPRYAKPQFFDGIEFTDGGWPGLPDLKSAPVLTDKLHKNLLWTLQLRMSGES